MSDEAYNDLLYGNGYHPLQGVISAEEAAAVRDLTLSRLDEGVDQNGQIAIRNICIGVQPSKICNQPLVTELGTQAG